MAQHVDHLTHLEEQTVQLEEALHQTRSECDIVRSDSALLREQLAANELEKGSSAAAATIQTHFLRHRHKNARTQSESSMASSTKLLRESQLLCDTQEAELASTQSQCLVARANLDTAKRELSSREADCQLQIDRLEAEVVISQLGCCVWQSQAESALQALSGVEEELKYEREIEQSDSATLRDQLHDATRECGIVRSDSATLREQVVAKGIENDSCAAAATIQIHFLRHRHKALRRNSSQKSVQAATMEARMKEETDDVQRQSLQWRSEAENLQADMATQRQMYAELSKGNEEKLVSLDAALIESNAQCTAWQTKADQWESQLQSKEEALTQIFAESQTQFDTLHAEMDGAYQECLSWQTAADDMHVRLKDLLLDLSPSADVAAVADSAVLFEALRSAVINLYSTPDPAHGVPAHDVALGEKHDRAVALLESESRSKVKSLEAEHAAVVLMHEKELELLRAEPAEPADTRQPSVVQNSTVNVPDVLPQSSTNFENSSDSDDGALASRPHPVRKQQYHGAAAY